MGGRSFTAAHKRRLMPRGAGEGTLRVPSPDLIFPLDRGSSDARLTGIGISLSYWGRNPLNWFCKPDGFRPIRRRAECWISGERLAGSAWYGWPLFLREMHSDASPKARETPLTSQRFAFADRERPGSGALTAVPVGIRLRRTIQRWAGQTCVCTMTFVTLFRPRRNATVYNT